MGRLGSILEAVKLMLNGDRKKLVENCVIVIIIGIIIIIAGGVFLDKGGKDKKNSSTQDGGSVQVSTRPADAQNKGELENELKAFLSQIDGAGKVDVMITYVSSKEIVPAYDSKNSENDTTEKDSGGGTRSISQSSRENGIAYEDVQGGSRKPIILKELLPEVKGVVIVADGASDPEVKEDLTKAVQVLLDVPIHKISVFDRKR